jgi:hypothetical protein
MVKVKVKYLYFLIALAFVLAMLPSCYYDNEEELYPQINSTCDTSNVTYSAVISPLLSSYCLGCHGASAASSSGGSIDLSTYALVKARINNIYTDINQGSGSDPMPKGGGKLTECQINEVKSWMNNGSLNN